jgi:putative endonuclease
MDSTRTRGNAGETLAASFLELVGLQIVKRNARLGGVEVDLLARDGATQVIVEVKLRGRDDFGGAAEAVDRRKRERLLRAAGVLAASGEAVRIDVVAIELVLSGAVVRHYRNAILE